ncbi:MAG: 4Fe-4S dicluster domain-containing protein [Chloroflexi bacterium]|nr:4Fe-4S dicluster domain-containing protein [Chloroflexota bacterium]
MQMGFYFDQTRCTGCFTCAVACKDWHDVPAGPAHWMRVRPEERGKYPDLFLAYTCTNCYHCAAPACVDACPVNAISKRPEDGLVLVDREQCIGRDNCGGPCLEVCSYAAPQFGAEDNPKMQKCDFCADRLSEGKPPACVAGCPTRALDSGPLEELVARNGAGREAAGFSYDASLAPAVVLKPKKS